MTAYMEVAGKRIQTVDAGKKFTLVAEVLGPAPENKPLAGEVCGTV